MAKVPLMKVEPPGPRAREIIKVDEKYLAKSTKTSPIAVDSAEGSVIKDVDGNTYLDFTSGVAVLNIGHCHPAVVKAVKEQAGRLAHFAGTDFYYSVQSQLVQKLSQIAPGRFDKRTFLSSSGTEAVEAALKVARWHTQRKQFVAFIGAFHGRTMGSLSLTASKPVQRARFFPLVPGVVHIPFAYCYRCPYQLEYPSCGVWCAKILEEVYFDSYVPAEEIAGLVIEPIQGEGGYIVPPVEFVRIMRRTAKNHGILLIDDEVQAGMGRTGKMWGITHYNVVPDIMCSAKALGSGMPIGATIYHKKYDFGVQGAHSNTFGGNVVACASALATIDVIEKESIVDRAEKTGAHLRKRLNEMMEAHEIIGDVRGLGMMQATEFVEDRRSKKPAIKARDRIVELSYKRGVILLPCGKSSIRYIPPLTTPVEQIDTGIDIISGAVRDASRELKRR